MPKAKRVPKEDLEGLNKALLGGKGRPGRSRVRGALGAWMDAGRGSAPDAKAQAQPSARRKSRATFDLPPELLDACRDAVVTLAGPPCRLTMSSLVEGALVRELARLKREHHGGKPFPSRAVAVRTGRPIR